MSAQRPSSGPLGLRLLSGVRWNILGQAAVLIVNFLSTPIILGHLGTEGYALYTLMWTVINYLTLFNLGTSQAAGTFTAQRHSQAHYPLGWLLRGTFYAQAALSLVAAAALFLGRDWVSALFCRSSPEAMALAPKVFICVAAAVPAYFLMQLASNILYGLQRFAAQSLLGILQSSTVALAAVALMYFGWGSLLNVALAFTACHFAMAGWTLWTIRDALARPGEPNPEFAREFVKFSWRALLSQTVLLIASQGDRVFLGSLVPLSAMGYYIVASSLAQKFNLLCGAVSATAFPLLAELYGQKDEPRLRRFYLKTTELILFINLPISILSFILVPQFMGLWLGADFSAAGSWPFRLLLWSNMIFLVAQLAVNLVYGQGHPQLYAGYQAAKTALTLILWPWLITRWGILGAAAGLLIGEAVVTPVFIGYVHKRFLKVGWGEFWRQSCYRPVVAGLALSALGLAAHGQVGTWLGMFSFAAAGMGLFFAAAYRLLDQETRTLLGQMAGAKLRKFRA